MKRASRAGLAVAVLAAAPLAFAHDPVFAPGPHTLFKGGMEVHAGVHRVQSGDEADQEAEAGLFYGLTGDWAVGALLPYAYGDSEDGFERTTLVTKYRFWRGDRLAEQESAALVGGVVLDSGGRRTGATDGLIGITYGLESLTWYRWLALRYRYNGETDAGVDPGDVLFLDAVLGVRTNELEYRASDWVWMLELNIEHHERARAGGVALGGTGGTRAFLSPGLMWTWRNLALKPGVQIPAWSDLNGSQTDPDYRAVVEFEAHL